MWGFALLLAFDAAGTGLQAVGIPLPADVIGLGLLAAALYWGRLPVAWVKPAARPLLAYLQLLFLPLIVGAWGHRALFFHYPVALATILVVAAVVSLLTAASVARWFSRHADRVAPEDGS